MPRDLAGRRDRYRSGRYVERGARPPSEIPDGAKEDETLAYLRKGLLDWDEATLDDREDSTLYRDFYDCIQWTADEIDELNDRRQPTLTNNLIAPKVNFLLGVETDSRTDPKCFPRNEYADLDAEAATDALRYATNEDNFDSKRSLAAKDLFIEGTGAALFDLSEGGKEPTMEWIEWDRIYWDPRSRKLDFSDASYVGIIVWMHREEAEDFYLEGVEEGSKEHERIKEALSITFQFAALNDSAEDAPRRWFDSDGRVQFFETFYKDDGVWHRATWTYQDFILAPRPIPFSIPQRPWQKKKGKKPATWCPLVMRSAFITRDGARYGVVRNMMSPQEEVNKRASKALHLIHNKSVISEDGAIAEPDKFQAELTRPDGNAVVSPGYLKENRIKVVDNSGMAAEQLGMMDRAIAAINRTGPDAASTVSDQRANSGKLFLARQQAASMELKPAFDALRQWTLECFMRYWWLIRQYWTQEIWVRVRDDDQQTGYRFVTLNKKTTRGERLLDLLDHGHELEQAIHHAMGTEGAQLYIRASKEIEQQMAQLQQQQQMAGVEAKQSGTEAPEMPEMPDPLDVLLESKLSKEQFTASDVAQMDVDIVLDTTPESTILKHEQLMELIELARSSPVLNQDRGVLQLLIELTDLPARDRRRLVKAMEPPKQDPKQLQFEAQQQSMALQQMQLSLAKMAAEVTKLGAETAKSQAQAQKASQEAQTGVPMAARLDGAQAIEAIANAQAKPHDAQLKQAEAGKRAAEAAAVVANQLTPGGAGGNS